MKLITSNKPSQKAFTLIEMIGVLAVIAILAALLIPKVFSAINQARVNGVSITINTVKSATADHYGKFGKFDTQGGTTSLTLPCTNFDNVLLTEGFIDKPFTTKIGTNSVLQLVAGGSENGTGGYKLDGVNSGTTNASFVVEAVMYGVTKQDAKDLNDLIDGTALGAAAGSTDNKGRVEYAGTDPTTVYIYVTHR